MSYSIVSDTNSDEENVRSAHFPTAPSPTTTHLIVCMAVRAYARVNLPRAVREGCRELQVD